VGRTLTPLSREIMSNNSLKVLDIACGSGFGSDYLAQLGNMVVGGDLSEETIADCNCKFNRSNLEFKVIDGTKIPYPDDTFDIVISFETIEHTKDYQKMLSEFKRVVKKDGLIMLSTPNFLINSPSGVVTNKFHTQEWVYDELLEILNNTFSNVKLMGQEYVRYKNKTRLKYKIGNLFEKTLYLQGFRKVPISLQDKIMNLIINEPMYPLSSNYKFTEVLGDIKQCKTFFSICKP
jgi:ubiquinone/menaquinone biosynthesis C-methylase UbiE